MLEQQGGATMTDQQLDGLLKTLSAYGQDVPLEHTMRLVRRVDSWDPELLAMIENAFGIELKR